jgi:hypothetical protein
MASIACFAKPWYFHILFYVIDGDFHRQGGVALPQRRDIEARVNTAYDRRMIVNLNLVSCSSLNEHKHFSFDLTFFKYFVQFFLQTFWFPFIVGQ